MFQSDAGGVEVDEVEEVLTCCVVWMGTALFVVVVVLNPEVVVAFVV